MRRTAQARSRIPRQSTESVSLFPFLAVLISTMGALVLLLVIVARQARLQAAEDTALHTAEICKDLQIAREWAQLEIEEYQYSRQKTAAQLAEARLTLGHLEDHARRLRDKLARLEATWKELQTSETDGASRRQELEAKLERLKGQVAQAERELAEAQEAAARGGSYAVVPYEGPHATQRRPIYIECRRDTVVLQPEGIRLGADDFAGPLGPGNPLDVALRAIREHLLRHQDLNPEDAGEPYPLLLVRPEGIEAYYAARAAMKSWGLEFGYELIDEDWDLEFQPPNPQLAQEVEQAVALARVRLQRLIAAAPRRFARKSSSGYVTSPYGGGLIPRGGSGVEGTSGYPAQRSFDRLGNRFASWDQRYEQQSAGSDGPAAGTTSAESEQTSLPNGASQQAGEKTPSESDPDDGDFGLATASDQPQSLAKVRGRNWGLPNAVGGWVPITAPIRIDCYPHRLVLVPERGLGQAKPIALGPRTEDAVDDLLSAVWEYIERWGSAGKEMYWRPVLSFRVAPGAETRYHHLKTLLDGSGLGVERDGE